MRRRLGLVAVVIGCAALGGLHAASRDAFSPERRAVGMLPEFTHARAIDWLNSAPLSAAALRGRPVLVEFWTFDCSNCLASLPWMERIAAEYQPRGLAVIAVHTPELPHERDAAAVGSAVRRLGIRYPVMIDADASYWRALDNQYWPAFYLFDADGRQAAAVAGELHRGDVRSDSFERLIDAMLAAAAGAAGPR